MVKITTRQYTTTSSKISYRFIEAEHFFLRQLKMGLKKSAIAYQNFIRVYEPSITCAVADIVVSCAALPPYMRFSIDGNLEFFSLRALVSYWLNVLYEGLRSGVSNQVLALAREAIALLEAQGYISLCHPQDLERHLWKPPLVIADIGYPQDQIGSSESAFIASGFSTIEFRECVGPFQCIRDPIGFRASNGVVTNAPQYKRPSLVQLKCGAHRICTIQLDDMLLKADFLPKALDLAEPSGFEIFVRGADFQRTPTISRGAVDFFVVGQRVVAKTNVGDLELPFAGFAIRFDEDLLGDDYLLRLRENNLIELTHKEHSDLDNAIQCGPHLLSNGESVLTDQNLEKQQFINSPGPASAAPINLSSSLGRTHAARSAVGLDAQGLLKIIIVEGTATGAERDGVKQTGATFSEVAAIAKHEGLQEAMALDSGGSVSLTVEGSELIMGGDYRRTNVKKWRPLAQALELR